MPSKPTALVIGTGAGGAMMARELSETYSVTVLERGGPFHPFSLPVGKLSSLRKSGLFLDERMITPLLPSMRIAKTGDMVLVRGIGVGGTTTLATGNAVRYDGALRDIGLDLDPEFARLQEELPITTAHQDRWTECTWKMYRLFEEMGLDPVVTPKFLDASRCAGCGHCAIGCPTGAKWDTRALLSEALSRGAVLHTGCRVMKLETEGDQVSAVLVKEHGKTRRYQADLVVLCAGGIGTPEILESSGIACQDTLFVDPVLCVAGPLPGLGQDRQLLMPFISQQEGYILSPYMDYLSFFFHRQWRSPMRDLASIMIKLADEEKGGLEGRKVRKTLTEKDKEGLQSAAQICGEFLERLGVSREAQFLGILNAGHPGGMLPLTAAEEESLHSPLLPANLYLADATLLPRAMGNPPILTILALSMRIAGKLR